MKKTLFFVLITATTFANAASIIGKYKREVVVIDRSAQTRQECKRGGGSWDGTSNDGMCFGKAFDTAKVSAAASGKYKLEVETIQPNTHSCGFEGEATLSGKVLTSSVPSEEYDHETGETKPVICTVTATFGGSNNNVTITNNGHCREFCGMNGWLETDKLFKVRRN